ncbi:IDEAL domain-containing protein [Paenibacillus sp. GCM10023252]|uniref:IDEAL domain-containing protein n=1 Tax=Paenibacillus sp. GCM10023252 TaxID=3252649 RepID=UPI00360CC351
MALDISDWVQARTLNGELVHGYIESVDALQRIATIHVVRSDNEDSVGKLIAVRDQWLKKLPDAQLDEQSLRELINLALATDDEPWFMELTEQLGQVQTSAGITARRSKARASFPNRLGLSGHI